MVTYESIYNGADSLNPIYSSTGYSINAGEFGTALDPRTANQIGEINIKINPGVKHFEVQGVSAEVWESIPKQHIDEIKRLSKLTGTKPSFHAPVIEASGVGKEGWNEENRMGAEEQLKSAVLRSHELDPDGNISVTVHSTAGLPEMEPAIMKGKEGEREREIKSMWVVDPETGKYARIEPEKRYFPEKGEKFEEKGRGFIPENELKKLNEDQWTRMVSEINRMAVYGGDIMQQVERDLIKGGGENPEKIRELLSEYNKIDVDRLDKTPEEKQIIKGIQRGLTHGQIYLKDAFRNMQNIFDKAYANAQRNDSKEDLDKLKKFAAEATPIINKGVEEDPKQFEEMVERGLKILGEKIETPNLYIPLNDFAIEQSAKTFANTAVAAYEKFGQTAPIINIENPPAGAGISRAEDLKKLVEKSRDIMEKKLVAEKGMSESEAKKISEKTIGATWDVGHINMLRKYGYSKEEIIEQTKTISKFVKHVHLSDNFGMEHTELPMGMGNVPIKEIMEKLNEKGFKGKKIIEAGNWWQHFADKGGGNPFKPTIEAFDSPIYAMTAGPSWGQPIGVGSYFMGHGPINPSVHHSIYGSGLTNLPQELGGEIPGSQSRFSGTPNQ